MENGMKNVGSNEMRDGHGEFCRDSLVVPELFSIPALLTPRLECGAVGRAWP